MDRLEFLTYENRMLNRHKGELIDKVWALEAEVSRLQAENNHLRFLHAIKNPPTIDELMAEGRRSREALGNE